MCLALAEGNETKMEIEKIENGTLMDWQSDSDGIRVRVEEKTNQFRDPGGEPETSNVPVLFLKTPREDFSVVVGLNSSLDHSFDAAGFYLRSGDGWSVKLLAERAPTGEIMAVSVVTTDYSDDCNGPDLKMPARFRVNKIGNTISWHIQTPDETWRLVRYARIPDAHRLELGLMSQTPSGDGIKVWFQNPQIDLSVTADIRDGS